MKKTIKINIPQPCSEDWDKMTPVDKGRFCQSCEKVVVDLTNKSDEQLVKELSGRENICGRLKSTQLNRELKLERKSGLNLAPYAAGLLLPLSIMANTPGESKIEKPYTSLGIGVHHEDGGLRSTVTTTGRITDEHGRGISGVQITIKESGKSEISGLRGHYQIKSLDKQTLIFEKDGFESVEVRLGSFSEERDISMLTDTNELDLGEVALDIQGNFIYSEEELKESEQDSTVTFILTGTVSDSTGPLPGVNVVVKGTMEGTQTDFDGEFSIEVSSQQILILSYIGYKSQEVIVDENLNKIDVIMEEDMEMLEGMIVVGGAISYVEIVDNSTIGSEIDPKYQLKTEEEYQEWKSTVKTAHANEKAYRKIKAKREKELRRAKRNNRKKQ